MTAAKNTVAGRFLSCASVRVKSDLCAARFLYALVVNGVLVCQYIADFVYVEGEATVCEDVKSPITRTKPEYRIKAKLMAAIHNLQVREV